MKYLEFIFIAVLAVAGSTAIVVFLIEPTAAPPVAEAGGVAGEQETPKSITTAEGVEDANEQTLVATAAPARDRPDEMTPGLTPGPKTEPQVADSPSIVVTGGKTDAGVAATLPEAEPTTIGPALKTYSLTATAVGGSVKRSPDRTGYAHGDTVTLEAAPDAGYTFTKWSGDLSGSANPAALVMEADKSVTAGFALKTYGLIVTAAEGSVTMNPNRDRYSHGDTVTLQAAPNPGYSFTNWSGDLTGNANPATLVMEADKSVTANFALTTYSLTVAAGDGLVKKSPDQPRYNPGDTVTLEAVPNTRYSFTYWSGDLSGSSNPATLVMDADKSVTAGFAFIAKASDVITNSIGMNMVYVPAGSFMMGSGRSAAQLAEQYGEVQGRFEDELPQHAVRISKGLWIGQTEVTQGHYRAVMNDQPWAGKAYVQEDANIPAVYVSWDEAVEFCNKLSRQEGKLYRLPTEAEWEYACRAGTTTLFSFGDDDSSLGDYAWFDDNADKMGQDYAHPVGQKKPNPWGIYDMHGNVFEWCSDYYDKGYYASGESVDPSGPPIGTSHSVRGGSWDNGANYLRCSYRSDYPVSSGLLVGFRVVSDGEAYSDVPAAPVESRPVTAQPRAGADSAKVQEEPPAAVKLPAGDAAPDGGKVSATQPAPQTATTVAQEARKATPDVAQKVPAAVPAEPKPAEVAAAQEAKDAAAVGPEISPAYASGNVYDVLDQAAVDARNGNVAQAQAALTSLLKDKDAAVLAGYELGLVHYENGSVDKALPFFRDALSAAFAGVTLSTDEQALLLLLDQEEDAARIRYELGLIYHSQGKQEQAVRLFRDSLSIISAKGATYIGVKKCKSCHFKQWNSWRKTKMATTFEVLKPGVRSEEKTKLKFDPNKDYTKDPTCLGCHTSGFGMPGGYFVPAEGDAEAQDRAEDNASVTCEGCHGPGSKSVEIQEDIKENKRPYKFAELRAVGFHQAGVRSCTQCHNASDPGKEPGYHFPYEEKRKEDQHENTELKYRQD